MGVRAVLTGLLLLLSWVNADNVDSRLKGRELGLADIPACGVRKNTECGENDL
jgi:hypothetical protein